MPKEPDYIGRSNPIDEQPEEHFFCISCGVDITDNIFHCEDGDVYCGKHIADILGEALDESKQYVAYISGRTFEVKNK